RTRRAQRHGRPAHPPGHHRPAVAHARVIRMRRAALAPAITPVARERGATCLDRSPEGGVESGQRLVRRGRHLLLPRADRRRSSLPGRGELLSRVTYVTSHRYIFSPGTASGQGRPRHDPRARPRLTGLEDPAWTASGPPRHPIRRPARRKVIAAGQAAPAGLLAAACTLAGQ